MSPDSPAVLERLVRDNNLAWIIDMYPSRDQAIAVLLERLDELKNDFRDRFHYEVSFTPEALKAEADRNPHKIRAFLQALGVSGNPEMLLMVWRILQGLSIREVAMNYRERDAFDLSVTLTLPDEERGQSAETYRSSNIRDAALLQHFGITTMHSQPLFDGFLPLRSS